MRLRIVVALGLALPLLAADSPRTKINPRDGLTYVWIAPGSFSMGCRRADTECFQWETPAHNVNVPRGFWIGQTEVTQQAYSRITGRDPSRYKGANLPVDQVSWHDARAYCQAIGMRLPTEIEWEYAAWTATQVPLDDQAWFDSNSADSTHPVATKAPNGKGLYDMLGNVWEWVEDSYATDPSQKILRGGAFVNLGRDLRASNRLWAKPETAHRDMGIRCAGD